MRREIALIIGIVVMCIGLVTLLGYALGEKGMYAPFTTAVAMAPHTAFALILIGIALVIVASNSIGRQ